MSNNVLRVFTGSSGSGSGSGGCFPGNAVAITPRGPKQMRELKVGDQVLAATSTGKLAYETIFAFTDSNKDVRGQFVSLVVQADAITRALQLTPKHFVTAQHTTSNHTPRFSASSIISAADLQIGDTVWIALDTQSSHVSPAVIVSVTASVENGWYAPRVPSGTIVVNGVVAATFTTALPNRLIWQVAMAFLRIWQPMQPFFAQFFSLFAVNIGSIRGYSI